MIRRIAVILSTLIFAFGILFASVLRSSSVRYAFSEPTKQVSEEKKDKIEIDYTFAYYGPVLPDHPLWYFKVLRDKLWLFLTTNPGRKAELNLLFADKRLSSSKALFERGKVELAFSTASKAEKYLEQAEFQTNKNKEKGMEVSEFSIKLAKAALKHRQVLQEILDLAPEDAKPKIIELENYPKNVYKGARDILLSKGLIPPESPFEGD